MSFILCAVAENVSMAKGALTTNAMQTRDTRTVFKLLAAWVLSMITVAVATVFMGPWVVSHACWGGGGCVFAIAHFLLQTVGAATFCMSTYTVWCTIRNRDKFNRRMETAITSHGFVGGVEAMIDELSERPNNV